jgi:ribosomal-protein-alanine N-acetyltransferase
MALPDLDHVLAIERQVFSEPWVRAHFEYEIVQSTVSYIRVARASGELVGYLVAWIVWDELHLGNVAVAPSWQHRGVATALLEEMLSDSTARGCRLATLEVRVSNERAIALYERLGFKSIAVRRRYYRDNGEDALIMMADLAQAAARPAEDAGGGS